MQQLAANLHAASDANESYAVSIVDAEVNIALGLRFLVLQYPTLYAVCGRHVTPLKKRGAEGLTGEVHAWAITNCRDGGSYMPPADVPATSEVPADEIPAGAAEVRDSEADPATEADETAIDEEES